MISTCLLSRSRKRARGSMFCMPCRSRTGRPAPRRITSSLISPTDSHSSDEDVVACIMASPDPRHPTPVPRAGLRPDAHHHLEHVIQALFVHLVRLVHVFN